MRMWKIRIRQNHTLDLILSHGIDVNGIEIHSVPVAQW